VVFHNIPPDCNVLPKEIYDLPNVDEVFVFKFMFAGKFTEYSYIKTRPKVPELIFF